jgi:hypothetical protein
MADDNQVTRTTVMHPLPSPSIADYDDYEAVANANGNDQVSFGECPSLFGRSLLALDRLW